MIRLSHFGFAIILLLIGNGCSRPGKNEIERTRSQFTAAEVRSALLPLFSDYSYDRSASRFGPPNYRALAPVPPEVSKLPLFSDLASGQEVLIGALEDDTNALIVFTEGNIAKWGVVVHRSVKTNQLPFIGGQEFSFWEDGVFFYLGSSMP